MIQTVEARILKPSRPLFAHWTVAGLRAALNDVNRAAAHASSTAKRLGRFH